MQIGIGVALITAALLLLSGYSPGFRKFSLYPVAGAALIAAVIIVAQPGVRSDRPIDMIQARAMQKHGKFIEAIDRITDKYGCREVIRPALEFYADPADNIENWPFKHPLCDPHTREWLLEYMKHDFEGHMAELLHAQIDDMNVVDAQVGCHSLARSGIGVEQLGVRWPDAWPYVFPPCTASPDAGYKPVADIGQSNNGPSEEIRPRPFAKSLEVSGEEETR
jgi:hypothetical protein